jgi:membrane protease YdiL (CAAX protease family)
VAILFGAVAAPVCEELLFRGFIYSAFTKSFGHAKAIMLVAFLFAIGHLSPLNVVALFLAGILFGYLRHKTGSIFPAIGAHALTNLFGILAIKWDLLARFEGDFLPWHIFLAACVLLFAGIFFMRQRT